MRFVEVKSQAQSDIQALHRARERYQRCGTALVAFAISNSFFAPRLYRFPLKGFRFCAHNASLLSLSESTPGTQASDYLREQTRFSLKALVLASRPKTATLVEMVVVTCQIYNSQN